MPSCVHDIARDLSHPIQADTLRAIMRDDSIAVADATLAYLLDGKSGAQDAVLLVSNPAFPDAVGDAIHRARAIAAKLDAPTKAPIVLPLEDGTYQGQTWGLFPRSEPMPSNRALRSVAKTTLVPKVAHWLTRLAAQTRTPADPGTVAARFTGPLQALAADTDLPAAIRDAATQAGANLDASPVWLCGEHGDFWTGNVLVSRGVIPGVVTDFHVIDWGGARLDGYPCIDLLRFAMSLYRPGTRRSGQIMQDYLSALDIPKAQGALYPLAAMGHLGANLDQFPRPRYLDLVNNVYRCLQDADLT